MSRLRIHTYVRPACSLLLAFAFAEVATAAASPVSQKAATLSLRGIQPGMTVARVRAALKAAGLQADPLTYGGTERLLDARATNEAVAGSANRQFLSTFVSQRRTGARPFPQEENVIAVFLPPPSQPVVWGVGSGVHYRADNGPSVKSTVEALVSKYGKPSFSLGIEPGQRTGSGQLAWYWDASGRQLGADAQNSCRQAIHNTYMVNQIGTTLSAFNAAARRPQTFAGAVKAGCAVALQAVFNNDPATGAISYLEVKLADLKAAYEAGMGFQDLAQRNAQVRDAAKAQAADARKPTL